MRSTPRLPPRAEPVPDAVAEDLRRLMGPVSAEPLALFRTIAHHEALLGRFRQIGSTLLSFGALPAPDRELIIHRTTARCGAGYEWGVHAAIFAPQVGGDDAWLRATWAGAPDDPAFTASDARLARACDELHDQGTWTDET